MRNRDRREKGKSGIILLEEAVSLLRKAPGTALVSYYVGSLPFYLGLLYFWTDMSRSPFAQEYLPQAAFGMSLLYIWMKCWHCVFAVRLRGYLSGDVPSAFGMASVRQMLVTQTVWQPFSLFVIPASLIMLLPYGWMIAYYQSLSLTGAGELSIKDASRTAWRAAGLWPGQNHVVLAIAWVLWLLVFVNIGTVILFLPELLSTLLGIETIITMSGTAILNTTFFAIVGCMTQLCVNPILKSAYVLRLFYGESLKSGADLKAELNAVEQENAAREPHLTGVAVALTFFVLICFSGSSLAAESPAPPVPPDELNQSIERVIHKREYQWRIPRQKQNLEEDRSAFVDFIQGIRDWIVKMVQPLRDLWKRFRNWLRRVFMNDPAGGPGEAPPLTDQQLTLMLVLLGVAAVILVLFLWRIWRRRKQPAPEVIARAITVVPDLQDENLVADQLPEDQWQQLAAELLGRGELRLAMRALYMASLAFLAGRSLITIARFKSNRDYQRELMRRAREKELLLSVFSENIALFERSWYGDHEVTPEIMQTFDSNHGRIRNFAQE